MKQVVATGSGGQLTLTPKRVIIHRKGLLSTAAHGIKGNKEIPIKNITAIQFKPAGSFTNGYIQFSILGGLENRGGLFDAAKDENTIMFTKKNEEDFLEIKKYIDAQIDEEPINFDDLPIYQRQMSAPPKKKGNIGKGCLYAFLALIAFSVIISIIGLAIGDVESDETTETIVLDSEEEVNGNDQDVYKAKDSLISIGAERLKSLKKTTDEFENTSFYHDKRSPKYTNINFVYPYIAGKSTLRLKFQYTADDWLFIKRVKILADGDVVLIKSPIFERDNDAGQIWEYADEAMSISDIHTLLKIANSKKAVIRYEGDQYKKDRVLTSKEKSIMKNIVETYTYLQGLPLPH